MMANHINDNIVTSTNLNPIQMDSSLNNDDPKTKMDDCSKKSIIKKEKFQYGNYNRYYGYRKGTDCADIRINLFRKEFFENKDILDIGCNIGHITLTIARDYSPRKIVGIDIDKSLIKIAKKNIRYYNIKNLLNKSEADDNKRIQFIHGNYIPESDECLQNEKPEFDTILCLSLTKWVHLNFGDSGVKRLFKKIYRQLRPGGCLLLEPQSWASYQKKSKITVLPVNYYDQ